MNLPPTNLPAKPVSKLPSTPVLNLPLPLQPHILSDPRGTVSETDRINANTQGYDFMYFEVEFLIFKNVAALLRPIGIHIAAVTEMETPVLLRILKLS